MYPLISFSAGSLLAAYFTVSYVGSLYIAKAGRLAFHAPPVNVPNGEERARAEHEKWRNDPDVIRARLIAATLSTVSSCLVVGLAVWKLVLSDMDTKTVSQHVVSTLGLAPSWPTPRSLLPHLLAPLLYVGPLYCSSLFSGLPFQSKWTIKEKFLPIFNTWTGWRNFIVAPITEELVFRSCIVSVMYLSGASHKKIIFLGPLWFGVAHAHHGWELYNIFGKTRSAMTKAVVTTLAQLTYTSMFGWFASFLLLRTGSIYPSISSHIFCNIMGLPIPGWYAARYPHRATAVWATHVIGIVGFFLALGPWTSGFREHVYAL